MGDEMQHGQMWPVNPVPVTIGTLQFPSICITNILMLLSHLDTKDPGSRAVG